MSEKNNTMSFKTTQRAFTERVRTQGASTCPHGISDERMSVYEELLFNNINSIISQCFPVIRSILSDEQWLTEVKSFLETHHASTPFFHKLPHEFLLFWQTKEESLEYPFLYELAHYEWLELHVELLDAEVPRFVPFTEESFDAEISLSPLAVLSSYRYPVNQIGCDFLPLKEENFDVVVYRDRDDLVRFMEVNQPTMALLTMLRANQKPIADVIPRLYKNYQDIDENEFISFVGATLKTLVDASIVVVNK